MGLGIIKGVGDQRGQTQLETNYLEKGVRFIFILRQGSEKGVRLNLKRDIRDQSKISVVV